MSQLTKTQKQALAYLLCPGVSFTPSETGRTFDVYMKRKAGGWDRIAGFRRSTVEALAIAGYCYMPASNLDDVVVTPDRFPADARGVEPPSRDRGKVLGQ